MCQLISKSHNERHSNGLDKLNYGYFLPLNSCVTLTFEILT